MHDGGMAMTIRKKLKRGWTRVATGARRRRAGSKAVAFLRKQSKIKSWKCSHGWAWKGHCAHTVACAYGRSYSGWDAYEGWTKTLDKHRRDGRKMTDPPRGALCFWEGGSQGYGHVAVSNGRKMIWTNDAPVSGKVGKVPLGYPRSQWGLHYKGWVWPDEVAGW